MRELSLSSCRPVQTQCLESPTPASQVCFCAGGSPGQGQGRREQALLPFVLWARADGRQYLLRPVRKFDLDRQEKYGPWSLTSGVGQDWSPDTSPPSSLLCCPLVIDEARCEGLHLVHPPRLAVWALSTVCWGDPLSRLVWAP